MSKVWRFTGNPENWITAIGINKWALNNEERNISVWNHINPGNTVLFHSTTKSDYHPHAKSSVIGYGFVDEGKYIKKDFWWVQEVNSKENIWPYVVPLKELYLFSDVDKIDFSLTIDAKTKEQIVNEINILTHNAFSLKDLNSLAHETSKDIPDFPFNGSASGVNSFYEKILLRKVRELYKGNPRQTDTALEEKLSEEYDEEFANESKEDIFKRAESYKSEGPSHATSFSPHKVRVENQKQKRRIAKLEDYTCQICGFFCEYTKSNSSKGWIIQVDHIIEKSTEGGEELNNLWVLCPDCHAKKTYGILEIDMEKQEVTLDGKKISIRDNHLFKRSNE